MNNSLNRISNPERCKFLPLTFKFYILGFIVLLPFYTYSQTPDETEKVELEKQEIERITVSGQGLDAAMRAFNAGDFGLAEIEFKKNAKCALRLERNKDAFIDGLQSNAINNSVQDSASIQSNSQSQGTTLSQSSTSTSNIGGKARNQRRNATTNSRTCRDRGYQLYMTGLSQIQLGRIEEAEKNFKTASFLNANIYDAHYRVALMQLLRNDMSGAKSRLSNVQDVLDRCRDCEAREEIIARISFLEKALSGEVKLN